MPLIPMHLITYHVRFDAAKSMLGRLFPEAPIDLYEAAVFLGETALGDGYSLPDTTSFICRKIYFPNAIVGIRVRRLPFRHAKPDIQDSSW